VSSQQPTSISVRPATGEDLIGLQELARHTIDASYRSFLGDEAVDWFISSGASDEHVAPHLAQRHVLCLQHRRRPIQHQPADRTRQRLGRVVRAMTE
jgi:hypothetical protein